MPIQKISVDSMPELAAKYPILDVRSPGEYAHAHIPGAQSLPLFSDEERKIVGSLYKQKSRKDAIKKGLEYFGPKMLPMVQLAEELAGGRNALIVHCWRGGMRSAAVAWLLDLYGFQVYTIVGGYKAFRQWVLARFDQQYAITVVGGYTGSGKTAILAALQRLPSAVLDLEALANHKGSAFGAINMPEQPTQEMFENKLAWQLQLLSLSQPEVVYVEDESQRIGRVNIPKPLWQQMRRSPLFFINIPFEERLKYLVADYGKGDKEKLINAVVRIKKRLGGLETKTAVNCLLEDDLDGAFSVLLRYYDKYYEKGLHNRENWQQLCTNIYSETINPPLLAQQIHSNTTTIKVND